MISTAAVIMQPGRMDAALGYARRGLAVFPCWPVLPMLAPRTGFMCGCGKLTCESPGKHPLGPLVRNGLSAASKDIDQVREWWTARPDANVAIATGDVIVLDVDPRHRGDRSLGELEHKHGALPPTRRVRTGGGVHIYFKPPPNITIKNSTGKLGPGLDIRGAGGYVLAPPSRHVSGNYYEWDRGSTGCAEMPAWIVAALEEPAGKQAMPAETWRNLVRNGVTEGQRNEALAKLAGHLLRHFIDPHVALELLMAWNAARCRPPLSTAEITTTVNSIARRELARRKTP
jgi:hypothetical protein